MNITTVLVALPFFAAAFAAADSGAFSDVGGTWYQSLNAPSFRPPSWLFGPVWTVLYVMIALAGTRLALLSGGADAPVLVAVCLGLWALHVNGGAILGHVWNAPLTEGQVEAKVPGETVAGSVAFERMIFPVTVYTHKNSILESENVRPQSRPLRHCPLRNFSL
ncbi:MAG: tryptophan-rich sensory protein, partial [Planctomycetota bacterium]